jgi:UDP-N-acetylmuramate dehydrogenase
MKMSNLFSDISQSMATMLFDESLARYSTIGIGGIADCIAKPLTKEGLQEIVKRCHENSLPYYVRGRGSNTIFGNVKGVVINTEELRSVLSPYDFFQTVLPSKNEGTPLWIEAEAGIPLFGQVGLARICERYGLSGMEFSVGIPGTLGGAVVMNAGVGPTEISKIVKDVTVVTPQGDLRTFSKDELGFAHRYSNLQDKYNDHVVYSVILELTKGNIDDVTNNTDEYLRRRTDQPKGRSIGSLWRRRGYVREDEKHLANAVQWYADDILRHSHCEGMTSTNGTIYIPQDSRFISYFIARECEGRKPELVDVVELAKRVYDIVINAQSIKLVLEGKFIGTTKSGMMLNDVVQKLFEDKYTLDQVRSEL